MARFLRNLYVLLLCVLLFAFKAAQCQLKSASDRLPDTQVRTSVQSSDLLERIAETTHQVSDLSSDVDFQIELHNLGMRFNVTGNLYYKHPDHFRLQLHDIPEFLLHRENDAFRTTNVLAGIRRDIKTQYNARIINQTKYQDENCYVIQLIPKQQENIARILLWVDANHYTMPLVIIRYDDGSTLSQRKLYTKANDVYVVSKMDSNYDAPGIQAEIFATFSHYKINQGMSDSVFEKEPTQQNFISTF